MRCVVFGATGYIGGRLVPELIDAASIERIVYLGGILPERGEAVGTPEFTADQRHRHVIGGTGLLEGRIVPLSRLEALTEDRERHR